MPNQLSSPTKIQIHPECLQLELAECQVQVSRVPKGWLDLMPEKYRHHIRYGLRSDPVQVLVETSASESLYPSSEPHDLNESSSICFESNRIRFNSDWCKGVISLAGRPSVTLVIHESARASFPAVLENCLRMLMAYLALFRKGVLLHSAAISRNGYTAVLFGHSGAGKSTVSELAMSAGCSIISDDINILLPGGDGWYVHPVPFSGTFRTVCSRPEPTKLVGLYRLNKAGLDQLRPCSGARAISLLSGSSAFVNCDPFRTDQLVDNLLDLNSSVPVMDMDFTRGPAFLQHIFKGDTR